MHSANRYRPLVDDRCAIASLVCGNAQRWTIFQFVLLATLIVAAGTVLAYTADRIGKLTGLGGTLAGFLLLAGATSLPELAIDCKAASIPWITAGDTARNT